MMSPKVLPIVVNSPGDILKHLKGEDKYFLGIFRDNLSDETKEKLQQLFRRLDDNGDNSLSVQDFNLHNNPAADKELKQMWEWFKKRFDFNNDGTITFDEFTEGSLFNIFCSIYANRQFTCCLRFKFYRYRLQSIF